jgi:hypothetical protein
MSNYTLSVLIPARQEEWLNLTIEDILKHKSPQTEIIVGLDGYWPSVPIKDNPDVTIIHSGESLGQRKMTKQCASIARGRYLMKVDAHCSFAQDFDIEMLKAFEKTGDNVVISPLMRNLWVFNWRCKKCGNETYQGPTPTKCEKCDNTTDFEKKVYWVAKENPQSNSFMFDNTFHFQYWRDYRKRPKFKEELTKDGITETLSLQGSCWMLSKEKYFELDIDSDSYGSWGNMGSQIACSFWLSGGRVLVNNNTYYAHLFRTSGDFTFPYPQPGREVEKTKQYIKNLFFENKFEKQIYPLRWLVERFAPVPTWDEESINKLKEAEKDFKPYIGKVS